MLPLTDAPEEEARAAELRQAYRLGYRWIDPLALAKQLGLHVVRFPVEAAKGVEGQYRPLPGGGAIFVDSATGTLRQRFTAAHEIGHFVLHRDLAVVDTDIGESAKSLIERQADRFAGALLVDRTEAQKIVEETGSLDEAVANVIDVFEVSVPVAAIALAQFGLYPQAQVERLLQERPIHGEFMRNHGYDSKHRDGDRALELDAKFEADVIELLVRGQVPPERAAAMLHVTVDELPPDALAARRKLLDPEDTSPADDGVRQGLRPDPPGLGPDRDV